ncbi:hypothetical protein V6S67_19830 [Arthrobacter sp. Soc17.1.1.1]|uniref:hypothetical protein n=1 Tax=Arthrobacter sp. Soc17.1.1.1 TaxID=3121277 RepID=UPI002FE45DEE
MYIATIVALPVIDSRPWLPHLVNTTALFLVAFTVVYALSVGVYERARRSAHAEMYVSADGDAVLVIERDVVNEGPVYRPRQHTVRKSGEGQGSRMRGEVMPRLAAIVDGMPGAMIQINAQNSAVKKIYLEDFKRFDLTVEAGDDGSATITYPAQTTPA